MAGTLEGELAVSVSSLDSGGKLVLRFNNTGSVVNKRFRQG